MLDTIKQNPIPSLIAGLSVAWLAFKGSSRASDGKHVASSSVRSYGREPIRQAPYETEYTTAQGQDASAPDVEVSTQRSAPSSKSTPTREKAQQTAGKARQKAGHMAGRAQGEMEHFGRQTQQQARRAKGRTQRMMRDNPMGLGVVALAAGACVGLMVPETRKEDEMLGPKRDQMMHKAKSKAKETMHRAEDVAKKTAKEAKSTAKEETKKQKSEMKQESEPHPKQS